MKEFTSYSEQFFAGQRGLSYKSAQQVIPIVQKFVPVRSVCDVGCGVGTWLRVFLETGVHDILGVDGYYVDNYLLEIPGSAFYRADLSQALRLDRSFRPSDVYRSCRAFARKPEHQFRRGPHPTGTPCPILGGYPAAGRHQSHQRAVAKSLGSDFRTVRFRKLRRTATIDLGQCRDSTLVPPKYLAVLQSRLPAKVPRLTPGQDGGSPLSVVHPQQYLEIWDELNVRASWRLFVRALQRAIHRRGERLRWALQAAVDQRDPEVVRLHKRSIQNFVAARIQEDSIRTEADPTAGSVPLEQAKSGSAPRSN